MYKKTMTALLCIPLWISAGLLPISCMAGEVTNVGQKSALINIIPDINSTAWSFIISVTPELWGDLMKDEQVAAVAAYSKGIYSDGRTDLAFRLSDAPQQVSVNGGLGATLTEMINGQNKMTVRLDSQENWTTRQDRTGSTWFVFTQHHGRNDLSVLKADDIPAGPGDYHITLEGSAWTE